MLTAARARKISEENSDCSNQKMQYKVIAHVKGISIGIQKEACQGYTSHTIDTESWSNDLRNAVIAEFESLGYIVKRERFFMSPYLYTIYW